MLGGKYPLFVFYNGVALSKASVDDFIDNPLDVLTALKTTDGLLSAASLIPIWFTLNNSNSRMNTSCARKVNLSYKHEGGKPKQQILANEVTLTITAQKDDQLINSIALLLPFVIKAVAGQYNKLGSSSIADITSFVGKYKIALFYDNIVMPEAFLLNWNETTDAKSDLRIITIVLSDNPYGDPISSIASVTMYPTAIGT